MGTFTKNRLWMMAAAMMAFASGARAETPTCNEVFNDPTIATCTCICEAGSSFPGCFNAATNAQVPTPNQCPDMLQGRRVLSRGDALLASDPVIGGSTTDVKALIYGTENDPDDPGIGVVDPSPRFSDSTTVPCTGIEGQPFPQQTRHARLFDLPYDMVVTLRPTTNSSNSNSDCTVSTGANLVLDVTSPNSGAPNVPETSFTRSSQYTQLAIDDFDYDGFDDIVFVNRGSIRLFTAADTEDPTKGLSNEGGISTSFPSGAFRAPMNEPTTGDFNGDGLIEVAWIGGDFPNEAGTLSVFFATICPGDVVNTICEGAQAFDVILDPARELFPAVSGATSTIVLDDAPLTRTNCGVVQTAEAGLFPGGPFGPRPPRPIATGVFRPGAVVLGNFEDNGINPRGASIDELVVTYVSGSNPCPTDIQYWSFSPPPINSAGENADSWARQRGETVENVLPEVATPIAANNVLYAPTINLYAQSAYLDWYGRVEQAVISVSGNQIQLRGILPFAETFYAARTRMIAASVTGVGDQAQAQACSSSRIQSSVGPFVWGSAVGRFSTSTDVNPDNPAACGDFADASPGDCPYNPQVATLFAKDARTTFSFPRLARVYTFQRSKPSGNDSSLKCDNDANIDGFLPRFIGGVEISGFSNPAADNLRGGSSLHAGDPFGNSVRLGVPTVTRISQHTQPQILIQAPPSLVDYVQPNSADSPTPAIVNFTRAPNNFNAQVDFDTSSSETASTAESTSYTASLSETVSAEVTFKVPLVSQVSVKNKTSWSQYNENNTSKQLGTYATSRLQTGGTIGVDDQLWWTQTTFNVFNFPVIGETVCPASLTCDDSDPSNIDCDSPVSETPVELTCVSTLEPPGCYCLSEGASASLCPSTAICSAAGDDVCCSRAPQQLVMSISGPEEVVRSSSPGANIEWYHPKHEVAQILSYASSRALLQAREPNAQILGSLTNFSTGTNDATETLSWTCGTSGEFSVGTTTRHSFATSTNITAGTNKIAEKAFGGGSVSVGFDYQTSDTFSSLNSYTVGQTASSSITVNLEGAGFFNTGQYAYAVQGVVLGGVQPISVLDTPDLLVCPSDNANCSAAQEIPADCTTTGPLTVAFAANPTATGNGLWWQANPAYNQNIDVALNNASRWNRVGASQVADPTLQCRGPAISPVCYTINQPSAGTTASDVWSTEFYSMKGLLITNGGTAGPQRDSATVADQVVLQLRVQNYSLKTMDPGTQVFARFYRQQLDVNNNQGSIFVVDYATDADGNPLPAVPIGPTGLGDTDPIPVMSPLDGSATIPPFNVTTDPSRDNISIALTSYVAADGDECEYEDGVEMCDGAYYAYWVTVWAQDTNGNVLSELPGHGLGAAYDPDRIYEFITDVPLEQVTFDGKATTFSNNVAMYKKVVTILPVDTGGALANAGPGELMLGLVHVSPEKTVLGEPVVVSAQVVSLGAATPGATVVFSDGDPLNGGTAFDAEWLPRVRADDAHFVRVNYNPTTCGTHEIFAEVTGGPLALGAEQIAAVDVGIDVDSAIDFLIEEVRSLDLNFPGKAGAAHKKNLVRELSRADKAFDADRTDKGVFRLEKFNDKVAALERKGRIDPQKAALLIAQTDQIIGCVW
jgi:hypothetical protein